MLKQRLITALILAPLVIAGILLLDSPVLALMFALVMLLAFKELARLAHVQNWIWTLGGVLVSCAAMLTAWWALDRLPVSGLQALIGLWWLLVTAQLLVRRTDLAPQPGPRPWLLVWGAVVLLAAWVSVVHLHASGTAGPQWALYLFLLIWVADSGAYFAGRLWGRIKLSPHVSPGKTWEGAAGAAFGATLLAIAAWSGGLAGAVPLWGLIGLSVLVTLVSIGGDLWESRLKREAGVKDSGELLPGHGGVLDRIDSLLAAAPVFALGIGILGSGA